MNDILTVSNLTMHFENKDLFDNLNFSLPEGSMTALLGANGTGKTTMVNILLGMQTPTSGTVKFAKNAKIGYVPQFRNIDEDYPLSIRSFIELNAPFFKRSNKHIRRHISHILKDTDLTEIQNTRMGEASGGQKQRAYLAQALLDHPDIIILDEATASLDPIAKEELMGLIQHLNHKHKMAVFFVTHDIPLAKKYMNNYLLLKNKTVQWGKIADLQEEAIG
ncbi:MAG: ATP-binding cassette domain-containing protein [Lactobacillus sp.]|nr:ATP-binding cassette domain-containing protein [Lactobacillus sp.]